MMNVKHDSSVIISDNSWVETNSVVAGNVRRFRRERELSLGELAKRAGLSKQTLSKIEAGEGNPTVSTLEMICQGLGVRLGAVLATYGSNVRLMRAADLSGQDHPLGTEFSLDRVYGTGYVETGIYQVTPGQITKIAPHSRGTLHQVYVISGHLRISGEIESVDVSTGDYFRFPGDITHHYEALGQSATVHLTTTAPQVAQFKPLH
ncbi:helix-turn-helix domain-containing protein [Glutamicibacter protophormiae]|uniref:helix-turn-helix domain-containing protein n=1 Tax=Glutamicibacter protophormiae TaxID=37930 RepID=UPI00360F8F07